VVTGASSGIGRAVAIELARRGCHLAICCANNIGGLAETAAEIRIQGRRVTSRRVNIAERREVEGFSEQVAQDHGRVDILVNNAGVGLIGPVADMSLEDFEWLMQINLWGAVYTTKAFLPLLLSQDSHIVNVSSLWGVLAVPGQAAYSTSKFALRGFTESLCQELQGTGVGLSLVIPGAVKTDIARNARFSAGIGPITNRRAAIKLMDRVSLTSPERAARIIVRGIEKNRRRVLIGPDAYLLDLLQRLFPSGYQTLTSFVLRTHRGRSPSLTM